MGQFDRFFSETPRYQAAMALDDPVRIVSVGRAVEKRAMTSCCMHVEPIAAFPELEVHPYQGGETYPNSKRLQNGEYL
jgi:hypothetical protein